MLSNIERPTMRTFSGFQVFPGISSPLKYVTRLWVFKSSIFFTCFCSAKKANHIMVMRLLRQILM